MARVVVAIIVALALCAAGGAYFIVPDAGAKLSSVVKRAQTWANDVTGTGVATKHYDVDASLQRTAVAARVYGSSTSPEDESLIALARVMATEDAFAAQSDADLMWHYHGLLEFLDVYYRSQDTCNYQEAVTTIYKAKQWWPGMNYLYCLERLIAEIPREFESTPEYQAYKKSNSYMELLIRTKLWTNVPPVFQPSLQYRTSSCVIAQSLHDWLYSEYERITREYQVEWEKRLKRERHSQNVQELRQHVEEEQRLRYEEQRRQQQVVEEQLARLHRDYQLQVRRDRQAYDRMPIETSGPGMPLSRPVSERIRMAPGSGGSSQGFTQQSSSPQTTTTYRSVPTTDVSTTTSYVPSTSSTTTYVPSTTSYTTYTYTYTYR